MGACGAEARVATTHLPLAGVQQQLDYLAEVEVMLGQLEEGHPASLQDVQVRAARAGRRGGMHVAGAAAAQAQQRSAQSC